MAAAAQTEEIHPVYHYSSQQHQGSLAGVQLFTPACICVVVLVLVLSVKVLNRFSISLCGFDTCIAGFFSCAQVFPGAMISKHSSGS